MVNGNNLYCRLSRVLAALGALLGALSVVPAVQEYRAVIVAAMGLSVALAAFLAHYCESVPVPP